MDDPGMDPKKITRSASPRRPSRFSSPWLLLAVASLCTPALIYWSVTYQAAQDLGYGDFLRRLEKGEVRSAKVGPSWITGELKTRGPGARSSQFYTSRVGLEDDQTLFR